MLRAESRSFHAPLPGSVQVKLQAGDLAVYLSPTILHWGSSYQAHPLRRTLHGGYRADGGACLGPELWPQLSPQSAAAFQRWQSRAESLRDASGDALRAIAAGDLLGFRRAVASGTVGGAGQFARAGETTKPVGPHGLRLRLIGLAKTAEEMATTLEREGSVAGWGEREVRELWRRLRPISDAMRCETLQWEPGFQGEPGLTPFSKLPPALLEMGEDLTAAVFSDKPAL